ncbi:alpha/beta hydrolase [Phenylobacterium sp.]|uniref:alpha/beta hydrolase n=1 Tax=Phenylobacterium sp. TaxID=1871053 RepID=UPI00260577BA|nr:alpha/beta hydrolase [Phenylobacterium sp.]
MSDQHDPMERIDPELRTPLESYLKLVPDTAATAGPELLAGIRGWGRATAKSFLAAPSVTERQVPVRDGAPNVMVYLINSDPDVVRPAVLHIHGGGFIAGSAFASVADLQVQAKALDCVIVTVEYRLAPETAFPGALEDNYAALLWLHRNAQALGVDRARIAIQGESAGGGHAAMLALAARDRGEVPICLQALTYPMVDDRTGSARQPPAHVGTHIWTRQLNVLGWTALLGGPPGGETAPAGAVPARASDLSGLPPAFIAVGDIDLFVDEDVAFAGRLMAANVPTELLVIPGAFHGFYVLAPNARVSRRYQLAHLNALARAFGRPELLEPPQAAPWGAPAEAAAG